MFLAFFCRRRFPIAVVEARLIPVGGLHFFDWSAVPVREQHRVCRVARLDAGIIFQILCLHGDDAAVGRYADAVALADVASIRQGAGHFHAVDVQLADDVVGVDTQTIDRVHRTNVVQGYKIRIKNLKKKNNERQRPECLDIAPVDSAWDRMID